MQRQSDCRGTAAPQLQLQVVAPTRSERRWWPALLATPPALDPLLWQRRAARGYTWHRNGLEVDHRRRH
jgi:hypothetical protein